jgi:hypothetical protein
MNASELANGLRILIGSENCDDAIRAVAAEIKRRGVRVDITSDDGEADAMDPDHDTTLWVVSDRALEIDGETVAEWTRCAVGRYGEAGDWCVEEDTEGNDELPDNVAVALDALGLTDETPDVEEPTLATDEHTPDPEGEYCLYWETVGDDAGPRARYTTREAAEAVCEQRNREFYARNPCGGGTSYLCGFSARQLVDGKWVTGEEDD